MELDHLLARVQFNCFKRKHGEKQGHDSELAENWIVSVWPIIHKHYSASEIYNCGETGLYFHALSGRTLCFKNEKLSGSKKSKKWFTVLLTANMDGSDKLQPLFMGKSANSHCFKGIKKLLVTYKSNKNFSMTATLFQEWFELFDACLQKQRKEVCLLLDNSFANKIENNGLQCIELVILPLNTTLSIQSLDHGIIESFKHYYHC